ncbi:hypothetical protein [Kitasatospora cineracea]|nr:hypothetical protein [Kitasatospora cineracea]
MDVTGWRGVRAAVFAALSVLLPIGARLLVTGRPMPIDLALAASAVAFAGAWALSSVERGYWAIAALLLPLQLACNALFNLGQSTCPPGASGGSGWQVLACGGGSIQPGLLGSAQPVADGLSALTGLGALVLLVVHLVLALAAAWWLRCGEAAVFDLLRALAVTVRSLLLPALARLLAPAGIPGVPLPPTPAFELRGPQDALLACSPLRGPPVPAGAR